MDIVVLLRETCRETRSGEQFSPRTSNPIRFHQCRHAAGTYDKASGTGGSNGSTMRFKPESAWGANAGLAVARERLDAIKAKYPGLTYADLWSLAGVVAIQEAGGPLIPWRAGRSDAPHGHCCPPDGRLPDAGKKGDHLRDIFYRMGFNDQEIVALAGAHALGRCHTGALLACSGRCCACRARARSSRAAVLSCRPDSPVPTLFPLDPPRPQTAPATAAPGPARPPPSPTPTSRSCSPRPGPPRRGPGPCSTRTLRRRSL